MIYDYVFEKGDKQKDIHALTDAIIRFSAAVLDVPKIIQKKFLKDLNKAL
jgi:hypothetical protein